MVFAWKFLNDLLFFRGGKNLALSAGLAILIVHGTRTWERNKDWRDEESLYRSALDINPPKGEVKPCTKLLRVARYCEISQVYANSSSVLQPWKDLRFTDETR